jgi:hypothetical protein
VYALFRADKVEIWKEAGGRAFYMGDARVSGPHEFVSHIQYELCKLKWRLNWARCFCMELDFGDKILITNNMNRN